MGAIPDRQGDRLHIQRAFRAPTLQQHFGGEIHARPVLLRRVAQDGDFQAGRHAGPSSTRARARALGVRTSPGVFRAGRDRRVNLGTPAGIGPWVTSNLLGRLAPPCALVLFSGAP